MATSVGIAQLRKDFSALVKRAASGEYILITVRGKPVAELRPPDSTRQAIQALAESGRAQWSGRRFAVDDSPLDVGVDLSSIILEDRH